MDVSGGEAGSWKWSTKTNLTGKCFRWGGEDKTQMRSYPTEPVLHTCSRLCNEPQDNFTGLSQVKLPAGFHEGALINQKLQELDPAFSLLMKKVYLELREHQIKWTRQALTLALAA